MIFGKKRFLNLFTQFTIRMRGNGSFRGIISEAEEFGEEHGQMAKELREADVADVEQFFEDQKSNGRNKHVYSVTIVM